MDASGQDGAAGMLIGFDSGGISLAGRGNDKRRASRSYRPMLEGVEALQLLSGASPATVLPPVAAEHQLLPDASLGSVAHDFNSISSATWTSQFAEESLTDFLADLEITSTSATAEVEIEQGLSQLEKYLNRAWYRAGIPAQSHDDCTQAVYATLLQQVGRDRFESLLDDVGHSGIKDVFNRETAEGTSFFRAVDMVKKRVQRERVHQSLDAAEALASRSQGETDEWRSALHEAIDRSLTPREASLINDTLMGKTPAEIALLWGVAAKTVSNEKTRVIQKLRGALLAPSLA